MTTARRPQTAAVPPGPASDDGGDAALQLAGELRERIRRERATVQRLKAHLSDPDDEGPRLQAPRRRSSAEPEGDDWQRLGECLHLRAEPADDQGLHLELAGEVDLQGALRLRAVLDAELRAGAREVSLDMAQVSFLDSNGLSALLWLRRQTQVVGGRLRITATHPQLLRLLDVTRLRPVLLPD